MMTMLTPASAVTPRAFNRLSLMRALQRYTSDVAYSTYANEPGAWLCCAAWLNSLILTVDVAAFLSGSSSAMQIRLNIVKQVRPTLVCLSIAQSESRFHVRVGRPDHLRLLVVFAPILRMFSGQNCTNKASATSSQKMLLLVRHNLLKARIEFKAMP